MNGQEIIEMGMLAGLCDEEGRDDASIIITDHMTRFAKLVAAKERERITALNAPAIEECNTYIANLERELQFTQKRLADLELSICQRAL
jgi:hypothetical protein